MSRQTSLFVTVALAALAVAACKGRGEKKKVSDRPAEAAVAKTPQAAAAIDPPPGPTGTIKGVVKFSGKVEMPLLQRGSDPVCARTEARAETILVNDNQTLRNVVVRVKPGTVKAWRPGTTVEVNQVDCMYRPRVQPAVAGQKMVIGNGDQTAHNVHLRRLEIGKRQGTETLWNRQQPKGMKPIEGVVGDHPVIKLKCDQHGWMSGYIVVSDNGYHTVTGDAGSFELEVPAGEITLEAWHEFYGIKEHKVTVPEGGEVTVEFAFDHDEDNPTAPSKESGSAAAEEKGG